MFYTIRHLTKFLYASPVQESVMELRMHPRSDLYQRCLTFHLAVSPRCRVFPYRDYLGNDIHHFDIPGPHQQLAIVAESLVEMQPAPVVPEALSPQAWEELDLMAASGDYWEMLLPSEFARPTEALLELAGELDVRRRDDPLTVLHAISHGLYERFEYVPRSTRVDSPIDEALAARRGVCQDFSHIMIALVRALRIPCRYVSGYLCHSKDCHDRPSGNATHAWVEALVPQYGWVGLDPTNDVAAGVRHIRTAIGRDYADVPPTRGIYRGRPATEMSVAVRVEPSESPPVFDRELPVPEDWSMLVERTQEPPLALLAQRMQQQ